MTARRATDVNGRPLPAIAKGDLYVRLWVFRNTGTEDGLRRLVPDVCRATRVPTSASGAQVKPQQMRNQRPNQCALGAATEGRPWMNLRA